MLVLLIIFMITAPMLHQGIEVALPKSEAQSLPNKVEDPLVLSINRDGLIYLRDKPVHPTRLVEVLTPLLRGRADEMVFLKGDRDVAYGRVVEVLDTLRRGGIVQVGMVTERPRSRSAGALRRDAAERLRRARSSHARSARTGAFRRGARRGRRAPSGARARGLGWRPHERRPAQADRVRRGPDRPGGAPRRPDSRARSRPSPSPRPRPSPSRSPSPRPKAPVLPDPKAKQGSPASRSRSRSPRRRRSPPRRQPAVQGSPRGSRGRRSRSARRSPASTTRISPTATTSTRCSR